MLSERGIHRSRIAPMLSNRRANSPPLSPPSTPATGAMRSTAPDLEMLADSAEIDIVARQPETDDAGDQDRRHDQQGDALLIGVGEFLDREGDARRAAC